MANYVENKTTKLEIFEYGFGGFGISLMQVGLVGAFAMYFFTDQIKISPAIAGTILLIGQIVVVLAYPILASIFDKTKSRWGRYRPYLIFLTPVCSVLLVLFFSIFNLAPTQKIIYYGAMYIAVSIVGNIGVGLACQSLLSVMSTDRSMRNFAAMSKQTFGLVAIGGGAAMVLPMVSFFGGYSQPWQAMATVYAIVFLACMWVCAHGARRHDIVPEVIIGKKPITIKEQINVLVTNKPLFFAASTHFLNILEKSLLLSSAIYLYKFVIGQQSLVSQILSVQLPICIVFGISIPFIIKKIGKRPLYMAMSLLCLINPLVLLIFKPFNNIPLIFGLAVFTVVLVGTKTIVTWSCLPDCVDYAEWKTGKRSDAVLTSVMSLVTSFAYAASPFLLGLTLGAVGYVGGVTPTPSVLEGIVYVSTIPSIIFAILMTVTMKLFPITDEFYNKMFVELKEIRAGNAAQS